MDLQQHAIQYELRDLRKDLQELLPMLVRANIYHNGSNWTAFPYDLQRALRALRIKLASENMTMFLDE